MDHAFPRLFWRLVLASLGVLALAVHGVSAEPAPASKVPIAVINSADATDLAALITAELSSEPGVQLVERNDLARLGDESKLRQMASADSVALGKMVGASGLLFIEKSEAGVHVRLAAVTLGFTIFDDLLTLKGDLPSLAKSIALRVEAYLPKLELKAGVAIPVSVLNLRAEVDTAASKALERNLTLLLESRLAEVPEFVVLERRHSWSMGLERSLDVEARPFLRGVYLVDGAVRLSRASDGKCSVDLRLRAPAGKGEKTVRLEGRADDLGALAQQLVAAIKTDLGGKFSEARQKEAGEGGEFLHEALWGWRSGLPGLALEAVDSAEMLGAARADVLAVRPQILCDLVTKDMGLWEDFSDSAPPPVLSADLLAEKCDLIKRAIQDTANFRDEKLDGAQKEFATASGTEKYKFEARRAITRVAVVASKLLVLLDLASSPHADSLRQSLRAITGYDPLHGQPGRVETLYLTNSHNAAEVFCDQWALTLDEELAWYRLRLNDADTKIPTDIFGTSPLRFCARFLKTPEEREKAVGQLVASLRDVPESRRTYLVLQTYARDEAVADAAYRDYLALLWPLRQELATGDKYSPVTTSMWKISGAPRARNPPLSMPLVHEMLNAEQPGRLGLIVVRRLWSPERTEPADALAIWQEVNRYIARRQRLCQEKEGRFDASFGAEMDSVMYYFREKYPEVVKSRLFSEETGPPLAVTRFWHPCLDPVHPLQDNPVISAHSVGNEEIWLSAYLAKSEKGCLFRVHLPDLNMETVEPANDSLARAIVCTPTALYAVVGDKFGETQALARSLGRYDFATAKWETRDLATWFRAQFLEEVNGDFFVSLGSPAKSQQVQGSGLARYRWKDDKVTTLASSRRLPPQNQFDDVDDYGVKAVFTGPQHRPAVTNDAGTFYIGEAPGPWPEVFDGRFHDQVVRLQDQSLVFNESGEVTLVDPTLSAVVPWMASDGLNYRKPKGFAGLPGPVSTPWASQTIFDCPPGKQKQMGVVAFHGDQLFLCKKVSATDTRCELLCYDKSRGRQPTRITLNMELSAAQKLGLQQTPGGAHGWWKLDDIENPRSYTPSLIATQQGLCLKLQIAGFWFIPYSDLEAYLKANPPAPETKAKL